MSGCVPYSTNSTEKDFSMNSFPSNPKRKAIWIKIINIHNTTKQMSK
ncbi:hypothetical protein ACFW04_013876 [Cataglyphis niger]